VKNELLFDASAYSSLGIIAVNTTTTCIVSVSL